jgi:hypothetical protein
MGIYQVLNHTANIGYNPSRDFLETLAAEDFDVIRIHWLISDSSFA